MLNFLSGWKDLVDQDNQILNVARLLLLCVRQHLFQALNSASIYNCPNDQHRNFASLSQKLEEIGESRISKLFPLNCVWLASIYRVNHFEVHLVLDTVFY